MSASHKLDLSKFKAPSKNKPLVSMASINSLAASPRVVEIESRKNTVIANVENIPSLPSIIFEITRIANSPKSCAGDIEDQMKGDQVLTAKLLKVSNSSYYALSNKATTVTKAVTTLGFNAVKSIVVASSVSDSLSRDLIVYGYESGGLWGHSLACAAISKKIGQILLKADDELSEELFVAGLLHDIGKIAISPVLELNKHEMEKFAVENATLETVEDQIVGTNHLKVGYLLSSKWNLNEKLVDAIAKHHGNSIPPFNAVIRIADILAIENKVGVIENYPWGQNYTNNLVAALGLTAESLKKLRLYIKDFVVKSVVPLIESMKI